MFFWHPSGSRWLVVTVAQKKAGHIITAFFFSDSPLVFLFLQESVNLQLLLSLGAVFSPALNPVVERLNQLSRGQDHVCHVYVFFNPAISKRTRHVLIQNV